MFVPSSFQRARQPPPEFKDSEFVPPDGALRKNVGRFTKLGHGIDTQVHRSRRRNKLQADSAVRADRRDGESRSTQRSAERFLSSLVIVDDHTRRPRCDGVCCLH